MREIRQIFEIASSEFGYPVAELRGKSRRQQLVNARHATWSVCMKLPGMTDYKLARYVGRDRGSIDHAWCDIIAQRDQDKYEAYLELLSAVNAAGVLKAAADAHPAKVVYKDRVVVKEKVIHTKERIRDADTANLIEGINDIRRELTAEWVESCYIRVALNRLEKLVVSP